jgi:hypothetical protein
VRDRKALEIVSQPGDGTKYHYIMVVSGRPSDAYLFINAGNTNMIYPDEIWAGEVNALDSPESLRDLLKKLCARQRRLNPWTAQECVRAVAIHEGIPWDFPLGVADEAKEVES